MGYRKFNQKNPGRNISKTAFTFIELLVAISIFSAVAISIYFTFNTGIFAWRRLNVATAAYQELRISLELMANEIASYIPSKNISLEGDSERISFLGSLDEKGGHALAKISFFFDRSTNTLMRSEKDLRLVLNQTAQAAVAEEFLPEITMLQFKYLCRKKDSEDEYEWLDLLDSQAKPVCKAVSISVAKEKLSFTKTVLLGAENKYE